MGKPYPIELRKRVVEHVLAGGTHRAVAGRFDVSPKCVHDVMKLYRTTGSVAPKSQGNPGVGKLVAHQAWVEAQIERKPDLTLDELVTQLAEQQGLVVHRSSMGRLLHRMGLSYKKRLPSLGATAKRRSAGSSHLDYPSSALHGGYVNPLGFCG